MTSEVEVFYQNTVLEVIPVSEVDIVEIVTPGPQGPRGASGITPSDDRPTTLNEVILAGVSIGLWP